MSKKPFIEQLLEKRQKIYEVTMQEEDIILEKTNFTIDVNMVKYLPYFNKGNYVIISFYPNKNDKKLMYITDTKKVNNNYIVSFVNKKNLNDSDYNSIIVLIDNVSYTKSKIKVDAINKKEETTVFTDSNKTNDVKDNTIDNNAIADIKEDTTERQTERHTERQTEITENNINKSKESSKISNNNKIKYILYTVLAILLIAVITYFITL